MTEAIYLEVSEKSEKTEAAKKAGTKYPTV